MTTAPCRPQGRGLGELPVGDEKREAVRAMFDAIAPRYDLVNKVMTFGLDIAWRRRTVRLLALREGSVVLDVACGTGDLVRELSRAGQVPIGIDLSAGMLAHARAGGAALVRGDAASLPFRSASLDGVVSAFALRNFSDLDAVLGELGRVVRPGGRIALLEVSEPERRLLREGHRLWFRHAAPLIGRVLSDDAAYRYLPQSVAYLPAPAELAASIGRSGFASVRRDQLTGGVVQVLTGTRA